MFKLMGKEINAVLVAQTILIWTNAKLIQESLHVPFYNLRGHSLYLQVIWYGAILVY